MKTKILIVDDEQAFTDTLAQRLEIRDFNVSAAYSGENALELFEKNSYDIVVLDVVMPGISGIETLQHIKKKDPLVQVIMLTGNVTVEKAIEGMKLGAYDFLMKPTKIGDLIDKINEAYELKMEHEKRIHKAEIDNIVNRRGW
jgi:DNA-binding NtrC family response regulator